MNRWLLFLVFGLLCACTQQPSAATQVMVVIDAQPQVRAMAHDVDVEVRTGSGPVDQWDVRLMQSLTSGKTEVTWPLELGLVPRDGDANRVYLVIATARDAGGDAVAQVRAISGYQAGKTLSLLLLLEDTCLGDASRCGAEQTCRVGQCVDAHTDPGRLPDYARDADGTPELRPFWDAGTLDASDNRDAGSDSHDSGSDSRDSGSGNSDAGVPDAAQDAGQTPACNSDGDCDDGDPCNGQETCVGGHCSAGEPYSCPAIAESCQQNVCVAHNGQASCEVQNIHEGERCADGDQSSDPEDSCARDYVCSAGACVAQTLEACAASACAALAGCDAANGCVYAPVGSSVSCDDADMCTDGDHCSDTDTTCAGTPKNCDDGVSCTVDACDAGTCTHEADDGLCTKSCNAGTCDVTNDCKYTALPDFTDCDDGRDNTSPDLCYRGNCAGGSRSSPAASCQVGSCGCSGFSSVRDLEYVGGSYVGLIEATQSGAGLVCSDGAPVSIVYDVTPSALTAYSAGGMKGGGLAGHASDIVSSYVIGETHVGVLDIGNKSVDWSNNYIDSALAMDTPSLVGFSGGATHFQGLFLSGGATHLWIWGHDSSTSTTARLVRCSPMNCDVAPCTPSPTCSYETAYGAASIQGASPYSFSGGSITLSQSYGGVVVPINYDSGTPTRRIYADGTNQDYSATTAVTSDNAGAWSGSLRINGSGQVLVYGNGSSNLVLCDDSTKTGSPTCKAINGLPNQSSRSYYKAALANGGSVLMLASSCTGLCLNYSVYVVVLPSGADPNVGSNWKEYPLANYALNGTRTTASALAGGSDSWMVLGMSNGTPYVWGWAPP